MKKHKTNRLITLLLMLCLIISSVTPAVYATVSEPETSIITDLESEPIEISAPTEAAEVIETTETEPKVDDTVVLQATEDEEIEIVPTEENVISLLAEETTEESTPSLYRLAGIENGDQIIVNANLGKTVTVIDNSEETFGVMGGKGNQGGHVAETVPFNAPDAVATAVAKVIFYLNDAAVSEDTEAPFTYDLSFTELGDYTVKAEIYDAVDDLLETIEKSFTVIYAEESAKYDEDYEGENPTIPENMVNQNSTVLPSSGEDYWKSAVETFNGSKALSVYTGKNYSNFANFAVYPDSFNVTGDLNRVLMEFDYSANQYSGTLGTLAIGENYRNANNKANVADYLCIYLPSAELKGASGKIYKTTRIGVDLSWDDSKQQVSYKVYLNGKEYYRHTTLYSYRKTIDPAKLLPVLNAGRSATQWQWYIDNVNVRAYNYVDQSSILVESPTVTAYNDLGAAKSGLTDLDTDISYITVDMYGGTDISTLAGNVTLTDSLTDKPVTLEVVADKLVLKEQLKMGTSYTLTVKNGVKNLEGKYCASEQTFTITTKTGEICADRENTGFAEGALPEVGQAGTVTFNSKVLGSDIIGKTVTVICAVYEGNKMTAKTISEQVVAEGGVLAPVSVSIAEATENTVVEAFIVDNLVNKKPITTEIYNLK